MAVTARQPEPAADLPIPGVHRRSLRAFTDARGIVTECFRAEWPDTFDPAQWVLAVTAPDSLRGMHVHPRHADWLVVADGQIEVALHDLRRGSPAYLQACIVTLDGVAPAALRIPPGVAHGLFARTRAVFALAADRAYDPADELGYHWRDPGLGLPWPARAPIVSPRDAALPPLAALLPRIPAWERAP